MYSLEEREKAVKLYIQYGLKAAKVIRELGYPNRHVIVRWYQEYQANQKLHEKRRSTSKYTAEQRKAAVQYYLEHGESYINTVRKLGYPSRQQLAQWLDDDAPTFTVLSAHCLSPIYAHGIRIIAITIGTGVQSAAEAPINNVIMAVKSIKRKTLRFILRPSLIR